MSKAKLVAEFILFAFLSICQNVFAQKVAKQVTKNTDNITSEFEPDVIYLALKGDKYTYYKNGIAMPTGLFYKRIGKEFRDFPVAKVDFKKCRKKSIGGFWSNFMVETTSDLLLDIRTPTLFDQNPTLMFGLSGDLQDIFENKAQEHLHRAVYLRNAEIKRNAALEKLMKKQ